MLHTLSASNDFLTPFPFRVMATSVVIRAFRIRKSKDRQHNGQKKKDKQRSTKHKHKIKDQQPPRFFALAYRASDACIYQ
jgi:hypothetical protein